MSPRPSPALHRLRMGSIDAAGSAYGLGCSLRWWNEQAALETVNRTIHQTWKRCPDPCSATTCFDRSLEAVVLALAIRTARLHCR